MPAMCDYPAIQQSYMLTAIRCTTIVPRHVVLKREVASLAGEAFQSGCEKLN